MKQNQNCGIHGRMSVVALCLAICSASAQTAPYAFTQAAVMISTNSAIVKGMVVANGLPAVGWFEWGRDSRYDQTTAPVDAGTGMTVQVVTGPLTDLSAGALYRCRLVVSNAAGVTVGQGIQFATGKRVFAWGSNSSGQTNVPAGLSNVVAVAAGDYHSLALKADGSVVGWGSSGFGQINVPAGLTNAVGIAAGASSSLALKGDGTVTAWGAYTFGQTNVPGSLTDAVAVAGGEHHYLALKSDGTVMAWGWNASGQTNVPSGLSNVVAVAGGGQHSLALKVDGTVVAWGLNDSGQTAVPAGLTNVVAVAGGDAHSLALKADGTLSAWGANSYSQTNVPVGLGNVVAIGCGWWHNLAVRADGSLVAWGRSSAGPSSVPLRLANIVQAAGGNLHTLALGDKLPLLSTHPATEIRPTSVRLNGVCAPMGLSAWAWFEWGVRGGYGQTTSLVALDSVDGVLRMSAVVDGLTEGGVYQFRVALSNSIGIFYSMPLFFTSGGSQKVAAWGLDAYGNRIVPPLLTNLVVVDGGYSHAVGLKSDGTVAAWGLNQFGQTNVPAGLSNVVAVSSYGNYSLALKSDGTVTGWGVPNPDYGQINVPTGATNVVSIAAGWLHALALKADGTVVAWGYSTAGATRVPVGLSNVVRIAACDHQSLALLGDGTLRAWGDNTSGQLNVAGFRDVVAVTAGGLHCAGLRADGTVVAWGWNASGQTNVPAGLSNVVAVVAGSRHCLALKSDGSVVGWGAGANGPTGYPDNGQATIPLGMIGMVAIAKGDFNSLALGPNVPPQAYSLLVTGAAGSDTPVSLPLWDPNGDPLTCQLSSFPAAGWLSQYTGNGPGAPLTPQDPLVTDPRSRVFFGSAPDASGWPYASFTCTASDGEADSAVGMVTVNLVPAPSLNIGSVNLGPGGSFALSFAGPSNATYRVWASTNLSTWTVLGYATQSLAGPFRFSDSGVTNLPSRFYRVSCP